MLIGLFGHSCTGKTTLAQEMAASLNLPLRGCGDVVKSKAMELSVSLDRLPLSEHQTIDEATREWGKRNPRGIVEGRYLDQVLADLDVPLVLVEITAADRDRAERWARRRDVPVGDIQVAEYDRADEAFRAAAYTGVVRIEPSLTISTSGETVDQCLKELVTFREKLKLG